MKVKYNEQDDKVKVTLSREQAGFLYAILDIIDHSENVRISKFAEELTALFIDSGAPIFDIYDRLTSEDHVASVVLKLKRQRGVYDSAD
jgi:hypothetical protein